MRLFTKPFTTQSRRRWPVKFGQLLVIGLFFVSISACGSVQWRDRDGHLWSFGLIHYSAIDTGRARIFVHRTAGLNLRLLSFDGGITFGYRKYISVQPCNPAACSASTASGAFWAKDIAPVEEGLYLRKTLGAEIAADPLYSGLLLGYFKQAILFGPRPHESAISKLEFNEAQIEATTYILRKEN